MCLPGAPWRVCISWGIMQTRIGSKEGLWGPFPGPVAFWVTRADPGTGPGPRSAWRSYFPHPHALPCSHQPQSRMPQAWPKSHRRAAEGSFPRLPAQGLALGGGADRRSVKPGPEGRKSSKGRKWSRGQKERGKQECILWETKQPG